MPFNVTRICLGCNQPFAVRRPSDPNKYCCRACQHVYRADNPVPLSVRFWQYVNKTDACWLWTGTKMPFGHGQIIDGPKSRGGKLVLAHRVSWEMHHGEIPDGLCVCHRCDVPACVRPNHLFLGTHADNMQDCASKSRNHHGESHFFAKMTPDLVREIRTRYANGGISQSTLAKEYGLFQTTVSELIRHKTWKHVD